MRVFFSSVAVAAALLFLLASCSKQAPKPGEPGYQRPNFLFIISDDQSWKHTSMSGYPYVSTPNIDELAKGGVWFPRAYAPAPTCTASRSAILTGKHIWQTGSGAVLKGRWEPMPTFQLELEKHGYHVGKTGKGWGPGHVDDWSRLPAGQPVSFYSDRKGLFGQEPPGPLAQSLVKFLYDKPEGKPFSFWIGAIDPHRPYTKSTKRDFSRNKPQDLLPGFLPALPVILEDFASYLDAIESFDRDLGEIVEQLDDAGELDNTIIVVTSDNGFPFSRGKAQNYDYGVRVPLAIYWKKFSEGDVVVENPVSLIDIAPTFLEAAGLPVPEEMQGSSLLDTLFLQPGSRYLQEREYVFTGFERHGDYIREGNLGYSRRAIHGKRYSLIRNNFHDRYPAGDPPRYIDGYGSLLREPDTKKHLEPYLSMVAAKRPRHELYDTVGDPDQLNNLSGNSKYLAVEEEMTELLDKELERTEDPVYLTGEDVFSGY
jgi:uncharacterized sulfatase